MKASRQMTECTCRPWLMQQRLTSCTAQLVESALVACYEPQWVALAETHRLSLCSAAHKALQSLPDCHSRSPAHAIHGTGAMTDVISKRDENITARNTRKRIPICENRKVNTVFTTLFISLFHYTFSVIC